MSRIDLRSGDRGGVAGGPALLEVTGTRCYRLRARGRGAGGHRRRRSPLRRRLLHFLPPHTRHVLIKNWAEFSVDPRLIPPSPLNLRLDGVYVRFSYLLKFCKKYFLDVRPSAAAQCAGSRQVEQQVALQR